MNERHIFITRTDAARLSEMLEVAGVFNYRDRADLESLAGELRRAKIVDSRVVPANVVTMNTRLVLEDLDGRREMEFALVFPADADADAGRVSVLSPVGTAVLGYAEGDTVEWTVPAGERRFLIKKILYQPEASGDFHR